MSLLCATVIADSTAELRRRRDAIDATGAADLIELRLDTVADPDAAAALHGHRAPVIVTCRSQAEGGQFKGSEEERRRILTDALALGADYVDVEWQARFDDLIASTNGRRIVVSMHDFNGIPSDLDARAAAMRATRAEVVKIAVTPRRLSDCVPLLDRGARFSAAGPSILLGMGPYGLNTRILAQRYGAAWTYAGALQEIGQLSVHAMARVFNFRALSSSTSVYGIVAGNATHSVSPSMHNAAFRATGVDAVYVPLPAVDAADFVAFGKAIGVGGASVTMPHKVTMLEHLDEVYPAARRIGAVNTIRVDNGRWIGGNTDAAGFAEPLRGRVALKGLRASILGAGGAARAVVEALTSSGATVRVHARDAARAREVALGASADVGPWPPAPGSWDLLVNTTPVGQYPDVDATPMAREALTGGWVYDLIYNPPQTRLMRDAAAMGCRTISGLDMLVAQAHEQFEWWTGRRAPAGVMREAALQRLAEFSRHENYVV